MLGQCISFKGLVSGQCISFSGLMNDVDSVILVRILYDEMCASGK